MTANGWIQIALFSAIVIAITRPFGGYMTRVFAGERTYCGRCCVRSSARSIGAAASTKRRTSTG